MKEGDEVIVISLWKYSGVGTACVRIGEVCRLKRMDALVDGHNYWVENLNGDEAWVECVPATELVKALV